MSFLTTLLVAALALDGQVDARVSQPQHANAHAQRRSPQGDANLISTPEVTGNQVSSIQAAGKPVTLQPIRPTHEAKKARREVQGAFGLMAEDALYWGGEDGTVAELWIEMAGEDEAIVDMEYFDDLVESMSCPEDGSDITITFLADADLSAAAETWRWVTKNEDNHFLLMVGAGDCVWNEDRILYHVQDLDYAPETKTVTLAAEKTNWKEAVHSYDLNVGKAALAGTTPEATKFKRDIFDSIGDFFGGEVNPDLSVPLDIDLSGGAITFTIDGISLSGTCKTCSTTGTLDVEATFRVRWFDIEEASIDISTAGLSATAIIALKVGGDLTDALIERSLPIFKASPAGIVIPGIVTIGPTVGVALTAGVSAIKGDITLTLGGTATIPASTWRLDFLNEAGSVAEGWNPSLETVPLEADLSVAVTASTSLDASIGLELSALGKLQPRNCSG